MTTRRTVPVRTRRDEPLTKERAELVRAVGLAPERGVRYRIPTAELHRMVKSGQRIKSGRDPAFSGINQRDKLVLTPKQRASEIAKAKRFFKSLHSSERWELNDQLVLGDFDWLDYFDSKPSGVFMNTLVDELSYWEQTQ